MLTTSARKNSAGAAIDRAVRDALATVAGRHLPTRAAFNRLLRHVRRRSHLLRPARVGGRFGVEGCREVVSGLLALATCYQDWLRPVEAWEPAGDNPRPQFSSLARHLLAIYPVPAFMASVWFKGRDAEARRQQGWFLHIGRGGNIRTADLPLPYTKRMAHHLLQAPDHLTVEAALRWGQVRGLGGTKELAHAVVATRLGSSFESEDFWRTVIHFLVNHPELDLAQVGPVVDYLHHQKFVPQEGRWEEGEMVDLGPPQPDLSMKGRTPRSLLRQVEDWHERLKQPRSIALMRWKPCGVGGFRRIERPAAEGLRCWTIRELTSAEALRREGEVMRHCAGSYVGACARRETSVWSMCFENDERRFRVMTIEVDPASRTVYQARRRCNTPPNEKALGVLRLWAAQEGLKLNFWGDGVLVVG
jgi:PcfJ-like protein